MATLIQSAQGLSDKVNANEEQIAQNTNNLASLASNTADALENLDQRVTENEAQLATNTNKIDNNETLINTNTSAIATNTAEIEALKDGINITPGQTNITVYNALPFGVYVPFDGTLDKIPQDFALVDGSLYNDSDLDEELVAILNKRYNKEEILDTDGISVIQEADPSNTTRLPDLSNRVIRGVGSLIALGEKQEDALPNFKNSTPAGVTASATYGFKFNLAEGEELPPPFYKDPRPYTNSISYGEGSDPSTTSANLGIDPSLSSPVYKNDVSEARVKALGTYYITRLRNTLQNPIVEELAKVTLLEPVNAGDALRVASINNTSGVISVNKLSNSNVYEFAGLAQTSGSTGAEITMQIKGLAPFSFGSLGNTIYLKQDGTYSTNASESVYYIGIKATDNELYMADRIFIGSSNAISKKDVLANPGVATNPFLTIFAETKIPLPLNNTAFNGDLVTYSGTTGNVQFKKAGKYSVTLELRVSNVETGATQALLNSAIYASDSDVTTESAFTRVGTYIRSSIVKEGEQNVAFNGVLEVTDISKFYKVFVYNASTLAISISGTTTQMSDTETGLVAPAILVTIKE